MNTGEIVDPDVTRSMTDAPKVGETMFRPFVEERLEKRIKPLSDVIKRPNVFIFTNRPHTDLKTVSDKTGSAKTNSALVTKLFMSLQTRPDADIDDFFRHENKSESPSLSEQGRRRS